MVKECVLPSAVRSKENEDQHREHEGSWGTCSGLGSRLQRALTAEHLQGRGCLVTVPIPGGSARGGGNLTPGVHLLRRAGFPAAGSGRALQQLIDPCSALSPDTVSSLVARAHPFHGVKEKSSALYQQPGSSSPS